MYGTSVCRVMSVRKTPTSSPGAFVSTSRFAALGQLVLTRVRLFLREPAAIFWVYGFPIIMLLALGAAFRDNPRDRILIDVAETNDLVLWQKKLSADDRLELKLAPAEWKKRLQSGKTDLVIEVTSDSTPSFRLWEEPRRAESRQQ